MEEEIRCFVCKEFYREPVLLPCGHALCRVCAVNLQTHIHEGNNSAASNGYQEADKASVSSETDSGVVCGSRPNSYAGTPAAPAYSSAAFTISCPSCNKLVYLDDNGAEGLPPFRVMRKVEATTKSKCSASVTLNENRNLILRQLQHTCQADYTKNDIYFEINKLKKSVERLERFRVACWLRGSRAVQRLRPHFDNRDMEDRRMNVEDSIIIPQPPATSSSRAVLLRYVVLLCYVITIITICLVKSVLFLLSVTVFSDYLQMYLDS